MKNKLPIVLFFLASCLLTSCGNDKKAYTLHLSEANRPALDSLLCNYEANDPRRKAAEFLVGNMFNKYWYEGRTIEAYDTFFSKLQDFRAIGITGDGHHAIRECWDSISKANGAIGIESLDVCLDCQNLSARYLTRNIDDAYREWQHVPLYADSSFETFLNYVLPYRIAHEKPEVWRDRYAEQLRTIRDTAKTPRAFLAAIAEQFKDYHHGEILKRYPLDISVSQMERGRNGTCRHNTIFCVLVLRALGLPVTMDYVGNWGNRSEGHAWNVLFLRDGGIYPFNAFRTDTIEFTYIPAKIFRSVYSTPNLADIDQLKRDVPKQLWADNAIDVTDQYVNCHDIAIGASHALSLQGKKYAVICIFDNQDWKPIWYGKIRKDSLHFNKMNGGVVYMAAIWGEKKLQPVAPPFLLTDSGTLVSFNADTLHLQDLTLRRKYPRLKRMELFAQQLRLATIEGANNAAFSHADTLMRQATTPVDMCDTLIDCAKAYRFFRWHVSDIKIGNLAEIEFYGKDTPNGEEHRLNGAIIGQSESKEPDAHPFAHAMDGKTETWFSKPKNTSGWVGIDLGRGKSAILTRVRYCPRSDTNFILRGDRYELLYWHNGQWKSAGQQTAENDSLVFGDVPFGSLYWLRDLTKGREERIFTYEDGKQIWY